MSATGQFLLSLDTRTGASAGRHQSLTRRSAIPDFSRHIAAGFVVYTFRGPILAKVLGQSQSRINRHLK
jgi:hypothetical protein